MPLGYSKYIPAISFTGDFVLLNLFFVFGFHFSSEIPSFNSTYFLFYLYLNFIWFALIKLFKAYKVDRNTGKKALFFAYSQVIIFFFFGFLMFFQLTPLVYYSRETIKLLFPLFFASILIWKYGLYYTFLLYRKRGYNYRNVLIIGHNHNSEKLYRYLKTNIWHGYRCLGFVASKTDHHLPVVGELKDLSVLIQRENIHELFVAFESLNEDDKARLIEILNNSSVKIRLLPDLGTLSYKSNEMINFASVPVININPGALSYWYNQLLKRCLDITISTLVIVGVLSWLTILLFLVDLITNRQGVFFRQRRTSVNGKEFTILKYRSMHINPEADTKKAVQNDERISKAGKFLRQTSIDELPQFINVFLGSMSVVGPRPHMLKHTEQYRKIVKNYMLRHAVKPGITGLAQVNGFRGEVKKLSDITQRVENDIAYIENWSFNLDLKIMIKTLFVLAGSYKFIKR